MKPPIGVLVTTAGIAAVILRVLAVAPGSLRTLDRAWRIVYS